jgi:hypothetical protein
MISMVDPVLRGLKQALELSTGKFAKAGKREIGYP